MCGAIYVGAVILFYLVDEAPLAGYLTYPGGMLVFGLADYAVPQSLEPFLFTALGNIALLVSGTLINVFSAYLLLRLVMVQLAGEKPGAD
jgi:hypothetical protein